jgi:hypothetical protein
VWQSRQEELLLEEQRHQILSLEQLGISPADILQQVTLAMPPSEDIHHQATPIMPPTADLLQQVTLADHFDCRHPSTDDTG